MLGLLYLPAPAALHLSAGAALGLMSVLSAKAVCDMRRTARDGAADESPPR